MIPKLLFFLLIIQLKNIDVRKTSRRSCLLTVVTCLETIFSGNTAVFVAGFRFEVICTVRKHVFALSSYQKKNKFKNLLCHMFCFVCLVALFPLFTMDRAVKELVR